MALNIKHLETEEIAHKLARLQNRSLRECVTEALKAEYRRALAARRNSNLNVGDRLKAIVKQAHQLKIQDQRSAAEILGYNQEGFCE